MTDMMQRLLDRIDVRGDDECWPWKLSKDKDGYGSTSLDGKTYRAHRLMYELTYGQIEDQNLYVMHTCDNPPCCNPAHLATGTVLDNNRQAIERGRQPGRLADDDVEDIKWLLAIGLSARGIAELFEVHPVTIDRIRHGRTHRRVRWPDGYAHTSP